MIWTFEDFRLDVGRRELWRGPGLVKIEPLAFDLLAYLVRNNARVVGKAELTAAVWRRAAVSDASMTTRVNALRRALGDSGRGQRLIRTLPRKGLRFVGEVMLTPRGAAPALVRSTASEALRPAAAERACVAIVGLAHRAADRDVAAFVHALSRSLVAALGAFRWFSVKAPPVPHLPTPLPSELAGPLHLDARYAFGGSVVRRGRHLSVTLHLKLAATGLTLWEDRCEGPLGAAALADRIALAASASVEPQLRAAEARHAAALTDPAATPYALHLQAHPIFSDGRASVGQSFALLERAIEIDPFFAPALADAANCLQVLDINTGGHGRALKRQRAVALARRALRATSDPEPVATAAFALAYFGEDMADALALIDHALALNPAFARGWYMNGMARLYAGAPDQALACFETSMRLSPGDRLGRRNNAGIGIAHLFSRRFDAAVPHLRQMTEEFPRWATPYAALAACQLHLGFARDAGAVAAQLKATDPSLAPNMVQFRSPTHRDLLLPGMAVVV